MTEKNPFVSHRFSLAVARRMAATGMTRMSVGGFVKGVQDVKRDAFSCGDLAAVKTAPIRSMQRAFRYLIATAGWTWRLQGHVAWSALTPLYALLYVGYASL